MAGGECRRKCRDLGQQGVHIALQLQHLLSSGDQRFELVRVAALQARGHRQRRDWRGGARMLSKIHGHCTHECACLCS